MRRIVASIMLGMVLTACGGERGALSEPTPNLRQQTATAVASRAISAAQSRSTALPTVTAVDPNVTPTATSTPRPTNDLSPITITPLPSPTGIATATPEQSPTPEATATPAPTATPEPPSASSGSIFFSRAGAVWRYDVASDQAAQVLPSGSMFRASPDGAQLAFVRDGELLLAQADGSAAQSLATNVTEAPVWAPDGSALAAVTGSAGTSYPLACAADNRINMIDLPARGAKVVGSGCQPAWAPDSKRLAYVTAQIGDVNEGFNTLALVNRQGLNGWTPVSAPVQNGGFPDPRRVMYAPFWSADSTKIYAFGFVGYRLLTDFSTLEQVDPVNGGTLPIGVLFDVVPTSVRAQPGGAWAAFATAGAKGTTTITAIKTSGEPQIFDYIGTPIEVQTTAAPGLEYASAAAWAPKGAVLAVVYCENANFVCLPGDRASLRLYDPLTGLTTTLVDDVDPESGVDWGR